MVSVDKFFFFTAIPIFLILTFNYCSKFVVAPRHMEKNNWQTTKYIKNNFFILDSYELKFFFYVQFFILFFFKGSLKQLDEINVFFFFFLVFFLLSCFIFFNFFSIKKKDLTYNHLILNISLWFYILFLTFPYITNLIIFLLALELLAVFYYFFFLNTLTRDVLTLVKLKNMLANYLWLSFLTMLMFVLGIIVCYASVGTVDFKQLMLVQPMISYFAWFLILFSIMWKIGSPGFHFFKLELYQYLPLHSLILFSLFTVYFNTYLLLFFFYNFLLFYVYYKQTVLILILLINFFILLRGLRLNSFYQFLGFSAINTWTTIFIMLLISAVFT